MSRSHFIPMSGFLPSEEPALHLPEATSTNMFNFELNAIAEQLPKLIREKKLRSAIDRLDMKYSFGQRISINKFNASEVNNTFVVLTMLIQAYLCEDSKKTTNNIPRILSENMAALISVVPRAAALTYADYVLHNWCLVDKKKGITLDNIKPLFTFTDEPHEDWFIKIHVVIEAAFAPALVAAAELASLAKRGVVVSAERLARHFNLITETINAATGILNLEGADKAQRLMFDLSAKKHSELSKSYRSLAAQSSVLPVLDSLLGARHSNDDISQYLREFAGYMPRMHRDFVLSMQDIEIEKLLKECGCPALPARAKATEALAKFREQYAGMTRVYLPKAAVVYGTGSADFNLFHTQRVQPISDTMKAPVRIPLAKL